MYSSLLSQIHRQQPQGHRLAHNMLTAPGLIVKHIPNSIQLPLSAASGDLPVLIISVTMVKSGWCRNDNPYAGTRRRQRVDVKKHGSQRSRQIEDIKELAAVLTEGKAIEVLNRTKELFEWIRSRL